jgi:hypothetical protein
MPIPFDPVNAATTMRTLAAFARQCAENGTALDREFVRTAVGELRTAQAWLDARLNDVDASARRPFVTKAEDVNTVGVEALIYTLRHAAIALLRARGGTDMQGFRQNR